MPILITAATLFTLKWIHEGRDSILGFLFVMKMERTNSDGSWI